MSNARELADTWPEIFSVDTKVLSYDAYRLLAVCNLPLEDPNRLREWAEAVEPEAEHVRRGRPRKDVGEKVYGVNNSLGKGNASSYLIRRIARERPDTLAI